MDHVEKLRRIVAASGLTQEALAERIGVSFVSINAWINGRSNPRKPAQAAIDTLYAQEVEGRMLGWQEFAEIFQRTNGHSFEIHPEQFDGLISGGGSPTSIRILAAGQYDRFLRAVASIVDIAPAGVLDDALILLQRAKNADSAACRAALAYPLVATWADKCLEGLLGVEEKPAPASVSLFNSIVGVAAWRAGVEQFEIDVPVVDGYAALPGLGRAHLSGAMGPMAKLSCDGGRLAISCQKVAVEVPVDVSHDAPNWQAVRRSLFTHQGATLDVAIDDVDALRVTDTSMNMSPRASRLEDLEFKDFTHDLEDAWRILVEDLPDHAESIAAGLQVIVPLEYTALQFTGFHRSGFGAILCTIGHRSRPLAQGMIEEFQRMKLNSLQGLMTVHTASETNQSYYAPWSEAPISFQGLLEGYYSAPATARLWSAQSARTVGEENFQATVHSLQRRAWAEGQFGRLLSAGELTPFGHAILDAVHPDPLDPNDLAPGSANLVRLMAIDHRLSFRVRNVVPDSDSIEGLASAWIAGMPVPTSVTINETLSVTNREIVRRKVRRLLSELHLVHPERYEEILANEHFLSLIVPEAKMADAHLAAGHYDTAIEMFESAIMDDPDDVESWTGLATAIAQSSRHGCATIGRFPEVVAALHTALLRRSFHESPLALANWLEPLLLKLDDSTFENNR